MTMMMKLKGCPMYLFCKLIWYGSVYPHQVEKMPSCYTWIAWDGEWTISSSYSHDPIKCTVTSLDILSIALQGNAGVPGKNGEAGEMVRYAL